MFKRRKEEIFETTVSNIKIEVHRKRIKNFYVRVNRRTGAVRVSCPFRISDFEFNQFIHSKLDWIRKQLQKGSQLPSKKELKYKTGEIVQLLGNNFVLVVKEGEKKSTLEVIGDSVIMNIRGSSTLPRRKKLFEDWYRTILIEEVPLIIKKYEPLMGVRVKEFRIKRMKTRWGTCNISDSRIWLSLELAKKSRGCLEMVVVHEMVHLLERLHNKRFYNFMDEFMPDWKIFNTELNSMID